MRVEREWLRQVVFGREGARRFTQDSPILPEVWLVGGAQYCLDRNRRIDLLLTPHRAHNPATLAKELQRRLEKNRDLETKANKPQSRGAEPEGGNWQVITRPVWTLAVSQSTVAVSLTLDELVAAVLPLTPWWERNTVKPKKDEKKKSKSESAESKDKTPMPLKSAGESDEVKWMRQIVGVIALCRKRMSDIDPAPVADNTPWYSNSAHDTDELADDRDQPSPVDEPVGRATFGDYRKFLECRNNEADQEKEFKRLEDRAMQLASLANGKPADTEKQEPQDSEFPLLWSISLNRRAKPAIRLSVSSTKADAARLLFNVKCNELTWAVVDTGIDATHPAFAVAKAPEPEPSKPASKSKAASRSRAAKKAAPAAEVISAVDTRISKTYDFTRLRLWTTLDSHPSTGPSALHQSEDLEEADRRFKQMRLRLRSGQSLDWPMLEPLLRISHKDGEYERPRHDHGTHVAGILAGCKVTETDGQGMCPDINLIDLRVLDQDGKGDEFSIIAALQFIRYLNATSDQPVIHGVNLSLSLLHDVENYACGRTPICEECERLVASGVVVVAAAGNRGFERVLTGAGELDAYRAISITDPGNAESVITVGATHRFQPHTYGVSYFSSRGPTGDGRVKPDVLAPGERIYSSVLNKKYDAKDGTSMAAPHVSGVAAMMMARHREFLGQPERIKRILMKTATDLGRERYFQGAGMVDALRALQAV